MARGHHLRELLRPERLALRDLRAGWREGRHPAVGRRGRGLDAGVRVLLVVVADEQGVVVPVQHPRDRAEADVGGAAVSRHADDVGVRALVLALADHRLVAGRHAGGEGAPAGDRRVGPRDRVGRAHVAGVGHVHAPRGADRDRVVHRRLQVQAVLDRRPAAGAGAVAGNEGVGLGQVGVVPPKAVLDLEQRQVLPLHFDRHVTFPPLGFAGGRGTPRRCGLCSFLETDPVRQLLDAPFPDHLLELLRHPVELVAWHRLAAHAGHERGHQRPLAQRVERRSQVE